MSTELVAGTPKRVRLLGENFVAFRGDDGAAGVLDENRARTAAPRSCWHAREGCALRCLYHGWKIDRSGAVLEMPPEPDGTAFTAKGRVSRPIRCTNPPASRGPISGRRDLVPPVPDFALRARPRQPPREYEVSYRLQLGAIARRRDRYGAFELPALRRHRGAGRPSAESRWEVRHTARPSQDGRPRILTEDTAYGFRYARDPPSARSIPIATSTFASRTSSRRSPRSSRSATCRTCRSFCRSTTSTPISTT